MNNNNTTATTNFGILQEIVEDLAGAADKQIVFLQYDENSFPFL